MQRILQMIQQRIVASDGMEVIVFQPGAGLFEENVGIFDVSVAGGLGFCSDTAGEV